MQTIHFLRTPCFPGSIVLPGAPGCMEQGAESGAWSSVHATWEPTEPPPEPMKVVTRAAVQFLIKQMPNANANRKELDKVLNGKAVAPSHSVTRAFLQGLSFLQEHPLNKALLGEKGFIKLDELAVRLSSTRARQLSSNIQNWDSARRAEDVRKLRASHDNDTQVPPIILMRAQKGGPDGPKWFIFDGCHRALAYASTDIPENGISTPILQAIFICGSVRNDHPATIYDTDFGYKAEEKAPYEALL
eukprot:13363675-Heterocapsa_arctica.AAC.2